MQTLVCLPMTDDYLSSGRGGVFPYYLIEIVIIHMSIFRLQLECGTSTTCILEC